MPTPLYPRQRQILGRLSHFAWQHERQRGATDLDEKTWRHAEVEKLTGLRGIKLCDQDHYATLKRHFLDVSGHTEAAFAQAKREAQGNDLRQWLFKLDQLLRAAGKTIDYARPLMRAMRRCELDRAGVADVRAVFFALQDRLKGDNHRRRKWQASHPAAVASPQPGGAPAKKDYFLK